MGNYQKMIAALVSQGQVWWNSKHTLYLMGNIPEWICEPTIYLIEFSLIYMFKKLYSTCNQEPRL
jgi:hypothetical protein